MPNAYNYTIVPQALYDNSTHHFCHQFRTAGILYIPNTTLDSGTTETQSYVQQADGSVATKADFFTIQTYAAGTTPIFFGNAIAGNCIYSYFEVHSSTGVDSSAYAPWKSPTNSSFNGRPSWCP